MTSLKEFIAKLPPERQAAIAARTQELVAEEMTLRDLRKARDLTQEQIAHILKIDQVGVSALERRADMLLSTLQRQVGALGGKLRLVAEFPDRPPVAITGFADQQEPPTNPLL